VGEMLASTSSFELAEWFAELKLRNEDHERAMEEAKSEGSGGLKLPSHDEIRKEHF
jgi:hypothetical protein